MSISHIGINNNPDPRSITQTHTISPAVTRDGVDISVLTNFEEIQIEGEPDLIVELIELYLEDAPRQMAVMQKALTNIDVLALVRAAHSLRGSSASLGARQMAALCEELEQIGCTDSFQKANLFLLRLEQEFMRVRQAFIAERQRRS